ncbi:MAG: hypothetical protein P8Y13_01750 [Deinococcales bacterium]
MRRLGLVAALVVIVAALGACTITITYSPPTNYTSVTASGSTFQTHPNALDTVTIGQGQTVYYQINVPSSIRSGYPLLYVELSQNVNLELEDAGGKPIASSHNYFYFTSGTAGLQSLGTASLTPAAILAQLSCQGSCVIVPNSASVYYAAITNNTGNQNPINVFAYGSAYTDSFEPQNDSPSTTPATLGSATSYQGDLETLGDKDYWYANQTGYWSFTAGSTNIDIAACTVDNSDQCVFSPTYDGGRVRVLGGSNVKVWATNGRAGAADQSLYTFDNFGANP